MYVYIIWDFPPFTYQILYLSLKFNLSMDSSNIIKTD